MAGNRWSEGAFTPTGPYGQARRGEIIKDERRVSHVYISSDIPPVPVRRPGPNAREEALLDEVEDLRRRLKDRAKELRAAERKIARLEAELDDGYVDEDEDCALRRKQKKVDRQKAKAQARIAKKNPGMTPGKVEAMDDIASRFGNLEL